VNYDVVGFAVLVTIFLVGGFVFFSRRSELLPRELLMVGLLAHIVGSQVRHEILYRFYGGVGDAVGYYGAGLNFADELWSGNLAVLGYEWWFTSVRASWWGTVFVRNVSGLVISVIGPTMRGEFLVFSMFAFAGLYFIATAAARTYPRRAARRFAWFIMLWPSLAYWPSSIGKEAVLLLGIGMVTIGYVGKAGRIRWSAVVAGGALVFAVRPHVAAALLGAVAVSHWLRSWDRLRLRQVFEGGAILVLAVLGLFAMQAAFGIAIGDLEGIQEFASQKAEKTQTGDSSIDQVPLTPAGGVQAFVNTWARPFLWEAHNATALLASLEIMLLWGFLLLNGRRIWASLKGWRRNRLLAEGARLSLPLLDHHVRRARARAPDCPGRPARPGADGPTWTWRKASQGGARRRDDEDRPPRRR